MSPARTEHEIGSRNGNGHATPQSSSEDDELNVRRGTGDPVETCDQGHHANGGRVYGSSNDRPRGSEPGACASSNTATVAARSVSSSSMKGPITQLCFHNSECFNAFE